MSSSDDENLTPEQREKRQSKEEEKARRLEERKNGVTKGPGDFDETESKNETEPKKTLEKYEKIFTQATQYFSSWNPDDIEETLINYLMAN